MYTMVLMMAVGGSADATAFGGRKASCHGGGYAPAYSSCSGSGYMPSYSGCTGYAAPTYGGCSGSTACHGSSKGGFLGGLFHRNKHTSCHGCSGYVAAPTCCPTPAPTCCAAPVMAASSCGGCGSAMVSSPVMMGGPVMAAPMMGGMMMSAPCMTPGMAPLGAMPAMTSPTPMPATPDKMPGVTPGVTPESKPAATPDKPAGGTKI